MFPSLHYENNPGQFFTNVDEFFHIEIDLDLAIGYNR